MNNTIIFVTNSFSSTSGGLTASIFHRAKLFQQLGYKVCITTNNIKASYRGIYESLCRKYGLSNATFLNMYEFFAEEPLFGYGLTDDQNAGNVIHEEKLACGMIRETMSDVEGHILRIRTMDSDRKILETEAFTCDGRKYLHFFPNQRGRQEKRVWYRKDNTMRCFDSLFALRAYWFASIASKEENPIFFSEEHGSDRSLLDNPYVEKPLKVVATIHSSFFASPYSYGSDIAPSLAPLLNNIERYAAVVCITSQERNHIMNYYGVHSNLFCITHPQKPLTLEKHIEKVPYRIVVCTRLVKMKRVDHIIQAVVQVHKQVPEVELLIYGSGPDESRLKSIILKSDAERYIKLMGYTNCPLEALASGVLTVSTSLYEGLGLSVHEAMMMGTPPIAYDYLYGPRFFIRDGENGRIVKNGSIDDLASAIADSLTHPEKLEYMSESTKCFESKLDLGFISQQWKKVFRCIDSYDLDDVHSSYFSVITDAAIIAKRRNDSTDSFKDSRFTIKAAIEVDSEIAASGFFLLFGDCQRIDIRDELYVQGRVVNHEESTYTVDFAVDGTKEELDALLGDCSNLRVEAQFGKHAAIATLDAGR